MVLSEETGSNKLRGKATIFLGRPAILITLPTNNGTANDVGRRSHKRSRPNLPGGVIADENGPSGDVKQVVRSMLRAHKLGVLVPLVYHADVQTGDVVLEAVPGRHLSELLSAVAAAPTAVTEGTADLGAAASPSSEAIAATAATAAEPTFSAAPKGPMERESPTPAKDTTEPRASSTVGAEACGTSLPDSATSSSHGAGITVMQLPPPPAVAVVVAAQDSGKTVAGLSRSITSRCQNADLDVAATSLGRTLAVLHDGGQVHGALSGDSVVLRESDGAVVLTDFRLSFNSIVPLDKARDLGGLEAALKATALEQQQQQLGSQQDGGEGDASDTMALATRLFEKVLEAYRSSSRQWSATHNKLAEVRSRALSSNKKAKA